ncbi:hypothetical protein POTOM_053999 [Populus tomentosa]|uniref:Uncharacterized protein n=1 Tax=Populus tomentosa TaxID=118781 RepID=A0A8X7Y2T9_POPTO|nr:hypothetical protein POTOM_053999 [Populus tomentosa]
MDSYKQILGAEGCSSSESGWTTYLASPEQEDEDDEGSYDGDNYKAHNVSNNYHYAAVAGEVSDDSMASDASSGPHHQNTHENGRGTRTFEINEHMQFTVSEGRKARRKVTTETKRQVLNIDLVD